MNQDHPISSLIHALFAAAVRDGSYHTVHALLREGADPRDETAIVDAATYGHDEIVRLLLHTGANVHAQNDGAICAAADRGHLEVVRALLDAGADFSVHEHGPLRDAEANGHWDVARLLREAGSFNPRTTAKRRHAGFSGSKPDDPGP